MPYISHIATAVPTYCYSQECLLTYFKARLSAVKARKKIALIFRRSGVNQRYSILPDFKPQTSDFMLFKAENNYTNSVQKRLEMFNTAALNLIKAAVNELPNKLLDGVTDLITVSCTGLQSPGLEIKVLEQLDLDPSIKLHTVNFRGCYGGMVALRIADLICKANSQAKILITDVELSTLHFQIPRTDDDMISSALFGDGAALALVTAQKPPSPALDLIATASRVILKGQKDMSWQIHADGFKMSLSSYVPELLELDLRDNLQKLFGQPLKTADLNWAIHPGGPRILDRFAASVGISCEHLNDSFKILSDYGNLSSATIFFILQHGMKRYTQHGKLIFTAAFGPGLTIEAALLKPII